MLTKRQARQAIRDSWAEFIANADQTASLPDDPAIEEVWASECDRAVRLVLGKAGRAALRQSAGGDQG